MKKYLNKTLLIIAIVFLAPLSHAEISDNAVNKLLDLSGLSKQVDQFPDLLKGGLDQAKQQGTPFPEDAYLIALKSIDEKIRPEEIIERIKDSLKQSMTEKEGDILLKWYESDLGKEITKKEENASTAESFEEIMKIAPVLLERSEDVAFAKKLDALLGATDMNMAIQENTGIAVFSAIMTLMQPNESLDLKPFKAQMDAARPQTRAAIEQMITASMVYTYRDIDTDKLNKYETFLKEPTSKKFHTDTTENLAKGLELSMSKWIVEFALELKEKIKS